MGSMAGPTLRRDIVEVHVFTQDTAGAVAFLQLRRARQPMAGSWQPVMGHIEAGETAVEAGLRELKEETGLSPMQLADGLGLWQLEAVNTFYLASLDAIMLCPGLAVQVTANAPVRLDDSHDQWRWVSAANPQEMAGAAEKFLWPGQQAAVMQISRHIAPAKGSLRQALRLG